MLAEYAVRGFAMDDQRLEAAGHDDYFDELLARIRDIRSSERVFWRKRVDADFEAAIAKTKLIEQKRPRRPKGKGWES